MTHGVLVCWSTEFLPRKMGGVGRMGAGRRALHRGRATRHHANL